MSVIRSAFLEIEGIDEVSKDIFDRKLYLDAKNDIVVSTINNTDRL